MRLFELATICRTYEAQTSFDESYIKFRSKIGNQLDFSNHDHMEALLDWLRKWGCRQFALSYEESSISQVQAWARDHERSLPMPSTNILDLSEHDATAVATAYEALVQCEASWRKGSVIRVGPTGAAKILFAARPNSLMAWDEPIRLNPRFNGSYRVLIMETQKDLKELIENAAKYKVSVDTIPKVVGREFSTLPKLIDEYNWVTLTNGAKPPSSDEIEAWYYWSR